MTLPFAIIAVVTVGSAVAAMSSATWCIAL
jgi:hypothetical protein